MEKVALVVLAATPNLVAAAVVVLGLGQGAVQYSVLVVELEVAEPLVELGVVIRLEVVPPLVNPQPLV